MSLEIFDCEQNSPEWFECRRGIPTASQFSTVMAKGQGKTRRTYMMKLLGERISGQPCENYSNSYMERGHSMEDEARLAYAFMNDVEPKKVGFMRNGEKGASPDSLVDEKGLLEIKTKAPHLLLEVLFKGELPPEHKAQVQGQIWVSEREWCDFFPYYTGMPKDTFKIERDDKYIKTLESEVDRFNDELNELEAQIRQRYAA